MPIKLDLVPLIEMALNEPLGLIVKTNDPARAKQQLYIAKNACGHPDIHRLQIRTSPWPEGQLILIKGSAKPVTTTSVKKFLSKFNPDDI